MNEDNPYPISSDIPIPPRRGKGRGKPPEDAPLTDAGVEMVRNHGRSALAAARYVLKDHKQIGISSDADVKRISKKIGTRLKQTL
jgi:hypothetical protein